MKRIKLCAGLALILSAMFACTLDYRLYFTVDNWNYNNDTCTVTYTITNTGQKTLYDVELGITVNYTNSYGSQQTGSSVYCGNLSVLETKSGTAAVYIGSGCTVSSVVITSAGWNDSDEDNSIFN